MKKKKYNIESEIIKAFQKGGLLLPVDPTDPIKAKKARKVGSGKKLADWEKDRKTKTAKRVKPFTTKDPLEWLLKDYSDFSSFNSAFRNARENNEKVFVYKDKRYNTNLVPNKQSELYNESKDFLKSYLKDSGQHNELDNLDQKSYFSITTNMPKGGSDAAQYKDGKILVSADPYKNLPYKINKKENAEPVNTAYINALAKKAIGNNYDKTIIPFLDIEDHPGKNLDSEVSTYSRVDLEKLKDPKEVIARKMELLYYLDKHKVHLENMTQRDFYDFLQTQNKLNKLPRSIGELVFAYSNKKDDLYNFIKNEVPVENTTQKNTLNKKKYNVGGELLKAGLTIGGNMLLPGLGSVAGTLMGTALEQDALGKQMQKNMQKVNSVSNPYQLEDGGWLKFFRRKRKPRPLTPKDIGKYNGPSDEDIAIRNIINKGAWDLKNKGASREEIWEYMENKRKSLKETIRMASDSQYRADIDKMRKLSGENIKYQNGGMLQGSEDAAMYKGASHDGGGIGVNSAGIPSPNTPLEVEGEEFRINLPNKKTYIFSKKLKV